MLKNNTNHLVFPEFDDIKVSTKTFIVKTNLTIDLKRLFDFLPVTYYVLIPKRRGRKKKNVINDENKNIIHGSIITMKYEDNLRGVDLKFKKSQTLKVKKWFRNSFTIVILLDGKPVNFKICKNGVLQVTGCKEDSQAEDCVKFVWQHIKNQENIIFTYNTPHKYLDAIFIPVMRNIDFNLGFLIDREKLARHMSTNTEFNCLLESSFGYTGVNIKRPIESDIRKMILKKLTFEGGKIIDTTTTYGDYIELLTEKERQKKIRKQRYNTFLIFQSGRAIFSGMSADYMRDDYYAFVKVIKNSFDLIEERLDV
jgi:TATA-box binding protein (TBP) (component of TFIID and TFIIIB)